MNTPENSEHGQLLAVPASGLLGPAEQAALDVLLDHIYEYGTAAEGVLYRANKLCQVARALERERWAATLERVTDRLAARLGTHAAEWGDVRAARDLLGV